MLASRAAPPRLLLFDDSEGTVATTCIERERESRGRRRRRRQKMKESRGEDENMPNRILSQRRRRWKER